MQVHRTTSEQGAVEFFKDRSKKIKSEISWAQHNLDLLDLDLRPQDQYVFESRIVTVKDDVNNLFCKWRLIYKDESDGLSIGIQIMQSDRSKIKAVCVVKISRSDNHQFLSNVNSRLFIEVPREKYGTTLHLERDLRMSYNINVNVEMEFLDIEEPKLILKQLGLLMEDESYSDFKFVFPDGRILRAHKIILAARSEVFRAMFSYNMTENRDNLTKIVDISYEGFKEFLRYIYTEEVPRLDELFMELFIAADKYGLEDLKCRCERKVKIEKAIDDFLSAEAGSEKKLSALEFIKLNIREVRITEGWKRLNAELLNEIFVYIFTGDD